MVDVENRMKTLPADGSQEDVKNWITSVLAEEPFPKDDPRWEMGDEKEIQLPAIEASIYREFVNSFGEAAVLHPQAQESRPNFTLMLMWELRKKYGFGSRAHTTVTEDGILRYFDYEND